MRNKIAQVDHYEEVFNRAMGISTSTIFFDMPQFRDYTGTVPGLMNE